MQFPWSKAKVEQLDLLDGGHLRATHVAAPVREADPSVEALDIPSDAPVVAADPQTERAHADGLPLMVAVGCLEEDPANPRTEFPEAELTELAEDIAERGVLQPIVVHPADTSGKYRIHFGAKRWKAAIRAGLREVPVVIRTLPADAYAQVAENQKRHGLTPLDLARFIRSRVDAGESNATIARRLAMNLTTVAHYLSLLRLPPELDAALKSGRCSSPRTLHELSKLHEEEPEQVRALLAGEREITRSALTPCEQNVRLPIRASRRLSRAMIC